MGFFVDRSSAGAAAEDKSGARNGFSQAPRWANTTPQSRRQGTAMTEIVDITAREILDNPDARRFYLGEKFNM